MNTRHTYLQASRAGRLRPSRRDRAYWPLRRLQETIEAAIAAHLAGRGLKTLVDFGCGDMPYRPLFEPHVERYVGCDLPGNPSADVAVEADGSLPFAAGAVDVVLSIQTLEHVENVPKYLAECRRVLSPQGRLILSTHGVWPYHPDPTDFWRWTCDGLRKVVVDAGLEVLEFHGLLGPPAYSLQILQDSAGAMLPRALRPLLFGPMQMLVQAADWACPASRRDRDAAIYLVVARPAGGAAAESPS